MPMKCVSAKTTHGLFCIIADGFAFFSCLGRCRHQVFRNALTRMFEAQESDAIFFETAMNLKRFPHMVLECVPLAVSAGETAPIYFKVGPVHF